MQGRLVFLRSAVVVKILVKNIIGIAEHLPQIQKKRLCFATHSFNKLYVNVVNALSLFLKEEKKKKKEINLLLQMTLKITKKFFKNPK